MGWQTRARIRGKLVSRQRKKRRCFNLIEGEEGQSVFISEANRKDEHQSEERKRGGGEEPPSEKRLQQQKKEKSKRRDFKGVGEFQKRKERKILNTSGKGGNLEWLRIQGGGGEALFTLKEVQKTHKTINKKREVGGCS